MPEGIQPPYLDPEAYPDYLQMQRKQMIAQMLMQKAQSAQTPPDWNGMRQIPHMGALSALAPAAESMLALKANKNVQGAQSKYFQSLYGPAQGAAPPSPQPDAAQWPEPPSPQGPYAAGLDQPPSPGLVPQPPAQNPQNPMIPGGMGKNIASALMGMMGPEKYAESFIAPNYKPAEIRASIRAAGIDPDSSQGRAMAVSALNKSLTNRENVRPGGTVFDNTTNSPVFTAPNNGVATNWTPQGPTQSVVPGAPAASAQMTGAETAGKVINTPQTVPTAGGGSTIGYPSDLLGTPPALRGQSAAGATQTPPGQNAPQNGGNSVRPGYFPKAAQEPTPAGWEDMPKLPISKNLGAPDEFTKGVLQEAGKKHAELASKYGQEADLADQKLQYYTEATKALPNAEVGPMSEWLTEHRNLLSQWGVPKELIPQSDTITPTYELNKNLANAALQSGRVVFPRLTQMETKMLKEEMSPSPVTTKMAISDLIQQDSIKQQYAKQRAEDYGKYKEAGGDPLRFESWYAKKFPLTKFAQQHAEAAPARTFDELPSAAQYKGKRIRDTTTNQFMKSDGTKWNPD